MTTHAAEAQPAVAPPRLAQTVHTVASVLPRTCGVRDFGVLLAAELREVGFDVEESWLPDDGRDPLHTLGVALQHFRVALRTPSDACVLWNYASYGYAFRGISFPGTLFGLLCRARGVPVITVLHELQPARRSSDLRVALHWATQRIALRAVLAGTSTPVVTMDRRADRLRQLGRADVRVVPVFSNIPVVAAAAPEVHERFTIGVLGFKSDNMRPEVLFGALQQLGWHDVRVSILGGPGPDSPAAGQWRDAAEAAGVGDLVHFSGILSADELSRRIQGCDVFAQMDALGASSRRGTIAAVLAHGRPMVTLDGPDRWNALAAADAVCTVPVDEVAFAEALDRLRRSPTELADLGARAASFYERCMRPEMAAQAVAGMVREQQTARLAGAGQVPVKWAGRFSRKLAPDSRASLRALRAKFRPADS